MLQQDLEGLRRAAAGCRECGLWEAATQVVFGEGPATATLMLVGEQPGDHEDRAGHPFVGPAGRVLDAALAEADIERAQVYVTNAVKHFKWKERGKRRIHDKPNRAEVAACQPWLRAEISAVKPAVIVMLGATAGQALLGSGFKLGEHRGRDLGPLGAAPHSLATSHPSALLRLPDKGDRRRAEEMLVQDLRLAASLR